MWKKTILITCMMILATFTAVLPIQTTLAEPPVLSNPYPTGGKNATYNPRMTISVNDPEGDHLTVHFRTNATGSWETLGTYTGRNKKYAQNTSNLDVKGTKYFWNVNATDGAAWTNGT